MSLRRLSPLIGVAAVLLALAGSGLGQQVRPVERPRLQRIDRSIASATTVVHQDRLEMKLDSAHVDVSKTELMVRGPEGWTPAAGALRALPGGSAEIEMKRGEWYLLQSEEDVPARPQVLTDQPVLLPGRLIYAPVGGAATGPEGEPHVLANFLTLTESPLPWSDERGTYCGEVMTGLVDLSEDGVEAPSGIPRSLPLRPPLSVVMTAVGAQVTPRRLEIDKTGTSGFKIARVTSDGVADSCKVKVISDLGEGTVVFTVSRQLGRIRLIPGRTRILGHGFGKTSIAVVREAEDGTPITGPGALLVNCTAAKGNLTPTTVEIADGESQASIELGSDGTGEVEIAASAGALSGAVTVEFVSPVLFVAVALIAGVLGGFLRGRKKGKEGGVSGLKLLEQMGIGALVSLGLVAVVTAGLVDLVVGIGRSPSLAVAIGLGLLAGYLGTPVFDLIIKKLGWKK